MKTAAEQDIVIAGIQVMPATHVEEMELSPREPNHQWIPTALLYGGVVLLAIAAGILIHVGHI